MKNKGAKIVDLDLHASIKARLRDAGSGINALARELGVTPSTITTVSQGYHRSQRIQGAIARKLGTSPETIWPDRYEEEDDVS